MNRRTARPLTPDEADVVAERALRFPAGSAAYWVVEPRGVLIDDYQGLAARIAQKPELAEHG